MQLYGLLMLTWCVYGVNVVLTQSGVYLRDKIQLLR